MAIVGSTVVAALALTVVEGVLAVAAVSLVLGYAVHGLFPAADAYMLSSLPDRHRASAYSLYSSTMMFVQASGSGAIGAVVASGVSYTVVFRALIGVVSGIAVVLYVLYSAGWLPAGSRATRTAD